MNLLLWRIPKVAGEQAAPPDHGFRPYPADVWFEGDIQQPGEGRNEQHDDRSSGRAHQQVPRFQGVAHGTAGEEEHAQSRRAAAIAAAETQIAQGQYHGDDSDKSDARVSTCTSRRRHSTCS
jgi:hypothetical protein